MVSLINRVQDGWTVNKKTAIYSHIAIVVYTTTASDAKNRVGCTISIFCVHFCFKIPERVYVWCFFGFCLRVKGEQCPNPFLFLIIVLAQGELSVNHLHPLPTNSLAWGLTRCALSVPVVCLCCNIIYCHVAAKANPCHPCPNVTLDGCSDRV